MSGKIKVYILVDKNKRDNSGFVGIFTYKPACENHKINREKWFKQNQNKKVTLQIIERYLTEE